MWGWLLASRFGRLLGTILATFLTLAATWLAGRRSRRIEFERERLRRYRATRRRMDDAEIGASDVAADREWLRERAERGRGV